MVHYGKRSLNDVYWCRLQKVTSSEWKNVWNRWWLVAVCFICAILVFIFLSLPFVMVLFWFSLHVFEFSISCSHKSIYSFIITLLQKSLLWVCWLLGLFPPACPQTSILRCVTALLVHSWLAWPPISSMLDGSNKESCVLGVLRYYFYVVCSFQNWKKIRILFTI